MKFPKKIISLLLSIVFLICSASTSFASYGDMDKDEIYTTEDVILTLEFASGIKLPTDEQIEQGDVDRDGYITSDDAVMILRAAAGQEDLPQHTYTEWVINANPTCTVNGVAVCKCEECGENFRKFIPPKGHTFIDGSCVDCGEKIHSRAIVYKNKSILFGDSPIQIQNSLGKPSEILADGSATIYIYASDYSELGILTFTDNKLTQFYTNSNSSKIYYDDSVFELSHITDFSYEETVSSLKDIQITAYIDTLHEDGSYAYSFRASYGKYYNFTTTTNYAVNEKLIFHLLNGCRAIYGEKPLAYCHKVQKAAYKHSKDMADRNYFDHTNPDGLSSANRITNIGIDWRTCGENIMAGAIDAYQSNNGWYNSSGHRSNMLNTKFENIGIGIAYNKNSDYRYYATQNFYTAW